MGLCKAPGGYPRCIGSDYAFGGREEFHNGANREEMRA